MTKNGERNEGSDSGNESQEDLISKLAVHLACAPSEKKAKTPEEKQKEAVEKRLIRKVFIKNWPEKNAEIGVKQVPPLFKDYNSFDTYQVAMIKWRLIQPKKEKLPDIWLIDYALKFYEENKENSQFLRALKEKWKRRKKKETYTLR